MSFREYLLWVRLLLDAEDSAEMVILEFSEYRETRQYFIH